MAAFTSQTQKKNRDANRFVKLLSHSPLGVLLFFCISGFILSYPILLSLENKQESFSWKHYLVRRIKRIEIPYILVLSIFFVGRLFLNLLPLTLDSLQHYFASFFYLHNVIYGYKSNLLPVAWSLEIEVQFYLIAPILCLFYARMAKNFRRIMMGLMILLLPYLQYQLPLRDFHLNLSLFNYVQYFLAGILAADLYIQGLPKQQKFHNLILALSFFAMIICSIPQLYLKPLMPLVLLVFLLTAIHSNLGKYIFENKYIYTIGGLSYSIYLIHMPILVYSVLLIPKAVIFMPLVLAYFVAFIIAIPILLVCAACFYYYIERPFMVKEPAILNDK